MEMVPIGNVPRLLVPGCPHYTWSIHLMAVRGDHRRLKMILESDHNSMSSIARSQTTVAKRIHLFLVYRLQNCKKILLGLTRNRLNILRGKLRKSSLNFTDICLVGQWSGVRVRGQVAGVKGQGSRVRGQGSVVSGKRRLLPNQLQS